MRSESYVFTLPFVVLFTATIFVILFFGCLSSAYGMEIIPDLYSTYTTGVGVRQLKKEQFWAVKPWTVP